MQVAEIFTSINGEGTRAGEPAVFVRFKGCNLRCGYCDTMWANEAGCPCREMSPSEIHEYIKETGIRDVTLTGGEPLLQKSMPELLELLLEDETLSIEIETNGAVDIEPFTDINGKRPLFTLDYKTPSSGCEESMKLSNYEYLLPDDTVKFVSGSREDLEKALYIIKKYNLTARCHTYISPVFGQIDPAEIVDFMIKNKMNGTRLQIQIHKVIWDPDRRGV